MRLTVQSRINVNGQWWDIETEHTISDERSSLEKTRMIGTIIAGIASTGEIISRVGANEQPAPSENSGRRPADRAAAEQAAFTWPPPNCKVHRVDMVQSKTQKTDGHIQYYCTKRIGEGYCKQRAKADVRTGHPNFWEVKE